MKDEGEPTGQYIPFPWERKEHHKGHPIGKVMLGVVVWVLVSFIGKTFIFGILGFCFMILIIYSDWWYPKFERWRRGY